VVFIYLPMNLRSSGNFGYAFVDFDFTEIAEQCKERLEGFTGWSDPSEKALEVAWSETQGLDSHINRYRDSPLMHESVEDELKPAMFKNRKRVTKAMFLRLTLLMRKKTKFLHWKRYPTWKKSLPWRLVEKLRHLQLLPLQLPPQLLIARNARPDE